MATTNQPGSLPALGPARCICGLDLRACEREQYQAQTSEPCDDRVAELALENLRAAGKAAA